MKSCRIMITTDSDLEKLIMKLSKYTSAKYTKQRRNQFLYIMGSVIFTVYLKVLLCYKAADVWQLKGRLIRRKEW